MRVDKPTRDAIRERITKLRPGTRRVRISLDTMLAMLDDLDDYQERSRFMRREPPDGRLRPMVIQGPMDGRGRGSKPLATVSTSSPRGPGRRGAGD